MVMCLILCALISVSCMFGFYVYAVYLHCSVLCVIGGICDAVTVSSLAGDGIGGCIDDRCDILLDHSRSEDRSGDDHRRHTECEDRPRELTNRCNLDQMRRNEANAKSKAQGT